MSEKFEKAIQEWYSNPNITKLDYLDLEFPKPELKETLEGLQYYCFHKSKIKHNSTSVDPFNNYLVDNLITLNYNINYFNQNRVIFSNVVLKNYKKILENQYKQSEILETVVKNQNLLLKKVSQLGVTVETHKPLTAQQVTNLVKTIAQQPKIVEAEALSLTENLNQKLKEVEQLVLEVKEFLNT